MYSKLPNQSAHEKYATVHVNTIDRGKLLMMLYDGCLKFLRQAKSGLEKKNIKQFARFLSKSQAIISELMLTLDYEKGGDLARDLERLYDFMLFHLTEANIQKNPQKIQDVIDLLSTISSAYRQIIESGKYKNELEAITLRDAAAAAAEGNEKKKLGESALEALPGKTLSVSF